MLRPQTVPLVCKTSRYHVDLKMISFSHFGVPAILVRVVMVGVMKKQTEPDIVIEWNGRDGATTIDSVDKQQLRELARILGRIAARRSCPGSQ